MSEWQVWPRLTKKRVALVNFFLISVIIIVQPKLPIPVLRPVQDFYDIINQSEPNKVAILAGYSDSIRGFEEIRDVYKACVMFLAKRQFKIIFVPLCQPAPIACESMVKRADIDRLYGYKYGVDYVIMPFISGEETAFKAIATDFWTAYSVDNRGTPIKDIPLMQRVHSFNDVNLVITQSSVPTVYDMVYRQWGVQYLGIVTYLSGGSASYYPQIVKGVCAFSAVDAAQFEFLTGITGEEILKQQAYNVTYFLPLIMVVANLIMHSKRTKAKGIALGRGEGEKA